MDRLSAACAKFYSWASEATTSRQLASKASAPANQAMSSLQNTKATTTSKDHTFKPNVSFGALMEKISFVMEKTFFLMTSKCSAEDFEQELGKAGNPNSIADQRAVLNELKATQSGAKKADEYGRITTSFSLNKDAARVYDRAFEIAEVSVGWDLFDTAVLRISPLNKQEQEALKSFCQQLADPSQPFPTIPETLENIKIKTLRDNVVNYLNEEINKAKDAYLSSQPSITEGNAHEVQPRYFDALQMKNASLGSEGWTAEMIGKLTPDQIKHLSANQLNSIVSGQNGKSKTVFECLTKTPEMTKALTKEQLQGLTSEQLKSLPQDSLSFDQISCLSSEQLKALDGQQNASYLSFCINLADDKKFFPSVRESIAKDEPQVKDQMEQMILAKKREYRTQPLPTPDKIATVPPKQLQSLTDSQLRELTVEHLVNVEDLNLFSDKQLAVIKEKINIPALRRFKIICAKLSTNDMALDQKVALFRWCELLLDDTKPPPVPPNIGLATPDLKDLQREVSSRYESDLKPGTDVSNLTSRQILAGLYKLEDKARSTWINDNIEKLSAEQITGIDPSFIAQISADKLTAKTADGGTVLSALTPQQTKALSSEQLRKALTTEKSGLQVEHLSYAQLSQLSKTERDTVGNLLSKIKSPLENRMSPIKQRAITLKRLTSKLESMSLLDQVKNIQETAKLEKEKLEIKRQLPQDTAELAQITRQLETIDQLNKVIGWVNDFENDLVGFPQIPDECDDATKKLMQDAIGKKKSDLGGQPIPNEAKNLLPKQIQSMTPEQFNNTILTYIQNGSIKELPCLQQIPATHLSALIESGTIWELPSSVIGNLNLQTIASIQFKDPKLAMQKEKLMFYKRAASDPKWEKLKPETQQAFLKWAERVIDTDQLIPERFTFSIDDLNEKPKADDIDWKTEEMDAYTATINKERETRLLRTPQSYLPQGQSIQNLPQEQIQQIPQRYFQVLQHQGLSLESQGWSTEQLRQLTPDQIKVLTEDQIFDDLGSYVIAGANGQPGFNNEQIQPLRTLLKDNDDKLTALTTSVNLGTTNQQTIQNLAPLQIRALKPKQFQGLNNPSMSTFTSKQLKALKPDQFDAFVSVIPGFPNECRTKGEKLEDDQVSGLSPFQVRALTNKQISSLSPKQLASIDLRYLSVDQLSSIKPSQMTSLQLPALNIMHQRLGKKLNTIYESQFGGTRNEDCIKANQSLCATYGMAVVLRGRIENKDGKGQPVVARATKDILQGAMMTQQIISDMFERNGRIGFSHVDRNGQKKTYQDFFSDETKNNKDEYTHNARTILSNPERDINKYYNDDSRLFGNIWGLSHQGVVTTVMGGPTAAIKQDPLCTKLALSLLQDKDKQFSVTHNVGDQNSSVTLTGEYFIGTSLGDDSGGGNLKLCTLSLQSAYEGRTVDFSAEVLDDSKITNTNSLGDVKEVYQSQDIGMIGRIREKIRI